MAVPLMTSDGFACEPLWVPPFRLARGDCLQIIAPAYDASLAIGRALADPPAGLRVAGHVHFTTGAWDERGRLARLVRPAPTAAKWVAQAATIPVRDAVEILAEFGFDVDPRVRISHLPGNYRALIGLAAAWAGRTDVLVFTAAGIDWTGRQWLTRQISRRLDHWAAIELSCPHFSQGCYQLAAPLFSGAVSVRVENKVIGMSA